MHICYLIITCLKWTFYFLKALFDSNAKHLNFNPNFSKVILKITFPKYFLKAILKNNAKLAISLKAHLFDVRCCSIHTANVIHTLDDK